MTGERERGVRGVREDEEERGMEEIWRGEKNGDRKKEREKERGRERGREREEEGGR